MNEYLNKYLHEREKMNQLYNAPRYKWMKYVAMAVIAVGIILLLCIAFGIDSISSNAIMIMSGCAGICAIIFVVLVTIISYQANKEHIVYNRNNNRQNQSNQLPRSK